MNITSLDFYAFAIFVVNVYILGRVELLVARATRIVKMLEEMSKNDR
jgi:hypothetical protein